MEGVNAPWAQPLATLPGSLVNLEPVGELPGSAEPLSAPFGPPFGNDEKATPPPTELYVDTLFTKAGDEVLHKYVTPTATPSTQKEKRFRI
uniref:Uncharacterized protein n=1 Tax=Oryza sativa subsp. japonica TaxID=39947 RepID=Q69IS2_ORYSJ|nr:hypothetical protein [Oryza sativa Japonica Group]